MVVRNMEVWKFAIPIKDYFELSLPKDSEILSFGVQKEVPCIWVLVKEEFPNTVRRFRLIGTGHLIIEDREQLKFIGTVIIHEGKRVWHLFEIV